MRARVAVERSHQKPIIASSSCTQGSYDRSCDTHYSVDSENAAAGRFAHRRAVRRFCEGRYF